MRADVCLLAIDRENPVAFFAVLGHLRGFRDGQQPSLSMGLGTMHARAQGDTLGRCTKRHF